MVRTLNEVGFKPKMVGGAMVGLQATAIKTQLGPLLNGFVNYETWVPSKQMMTPEVEAFLKEYQARAGAEGVDPLGYYLGTWGYAYIELLGKAVEGAKSLDDNKIADYLRANPIKTIMGDIKFGKNGEWAESGMMQVQYHGIKSNALDQFRGMDTQTVVHPPKLETGKVIYPFEKARLTGIRNIGAAFVARRRFCLASEKMLLPTTLVGSYPQPDWLIDRAKLSKQVPRVRATDLWLIDEKYLEAAQDDATLLGDPRSGTRRARHRQ